jgi:hypothetical protein
MDCGTRHSETLLQQDDATEAMPIHGQSNKEMQIVSPLTSQKVFALQISMFCVGVNGLQNEIQSELITTTYLSGE